MAKKNKLTKSKSLYTIKNRHSLTNNGVIYENDHFTIIPNDGLFDDNEGSIIFSESNFKYKISLENNGKKRHVRRGFVKNDDDSIIWTLDKLSANTSTSKESKIVLKPNYSSLKDFAYYGSAVELVKATVQDIIRRFPGGITNYKDKNTAPKIVIDDKEYTLLSNEVEIDCWTGGGTIAPQNVKNPMRVLACSYMNYEDNGEALTSPPTFKPIATCLNSIIGEVTINNKTFPLYMDANGKKFLLDNGNSINIKPKKAIIDEFWDSLDDFERVLLNRDSTPIYKAVFETPYSNEKGYYYTNKSYIWPTIDEEGFFLDLTTLNFQGYLASLLSLAEYHDEYDSDNIWRMMTHESIKNLDWTHKSYNDLEGDELDDFDTKGFGAMLRVYGRQFDDIKRYADNIKSMSNISYDEKNNMPDYFLSDVVDRDGWNTQNVHPCNVTEEDINSVFLRRLALSSNYIQSLKGTVRGIEAILGMFGYTRTNNDDTTIGTFTINEPIHVFSGLPYYNTYRLRNYYNSVYEHPNVVHLMEGFPVALIPCTMEDGDKGYLVPWHIENKSDFYFQSYGGWGKIDEKKINLPNTLTTATTLTSEDDISIYGETLPYMRYANTIDEMLMISNEDLYENIICYVADITNIKDVYVVRDGDVADDFSHYFSLKNLTLSTRCGFISNTTYNCYGWKNITNNEIMECNTLDGKRVVYLESLISEFKGNNPHVGYGHYDDGEAYIKRFTNIFGHLFEEGVFDYVEGEDKEDYETLSKGYGFEKINTLENSKKCAYFHDYTEEGDRKERGLPLLISVGGEDNIDNWNSKEVVSVKFPDTPDSVTGVADESQANSIMNVKNIIITFNIGNNEFFKKYLQTVVFKYLEEMIPSTAILEYRFT